MSRELEHRTVEISTSGAKTNEALISGEGNNALYHIIDVVLDVSGDASVTLHSGGKTIIKRNFDTNRGHHFDATGADLFGDRGNLLMDVSAAVNVTGKLVYWREHMGARYVQTAEQRKAGY